MIINKGSGGSGAADLAPIHAELDGKVGNDDFAPGSTLMGSEDGPVPLPGSLYSDATCWDVVTGAVLGAAPEFERTANAIRRYEHVQTPVTPEDGVASMIYPTDPSVDAENANITGLMGVATDEATVAIAFPEPADEAVLAAYQGNVLLRNGAVIEHSGPSGTLTVGLAAPAEGRLPVVWGTGLSNVTLFPGERLHVAVEFLEGTGVARQIKFPAQYAAISTVQAVVTLGPNPSNLSEILPDDWVFSVGWHNTANTPVVGLNGLYTALTGTGFTDGNYQAGASTRQHTIGHARANVTGDFTTPSHANGGVSGAIALRGVGGLVPGKVVSGDGVGATINWSPLTDLPPGSAVIAFVSAATTPAVTPAGMTQAAFRESSGLSNTIGVILDVTSFDPADADLGGSVAWSYTFVALYPALL